MSRIEQRLDVTFRVGMKTLKVTKFMKKSCWDHQNMLDRIVAGIGGHRNHSLMGMIRPAKKLATKFETTNRAVSNAETTCHQRPGAPRPSK
jgi:hypothetical protein